MKKGLFTKTVLATFISMTLVGTASAELVYRHPVDGAKASSGGIYGGSGSNGGGSDTGAETGTDTGSETDTEEEEQAGELTAWQQYAIDTNMIPHTYDPEDSSNNSFNWAQFAGPSHSGLPELPSEIYPINELDSGAVMTISAINGNLTDLNGFRTTARVDAANFMRNNLSDVDELINMVDMGYVNLSSNANLTDLSGLSNVSSLRDNAKLIIDSNFAERAGTVGIDPSSILCDPSVSDIYGGATQDDVCAYLQ